jgi:PEP-CTERM motif
MTYTNPSSTLSTIDNDRASVWAGNTLLFDNVNVQTATQSIADLKFVFSTGVGTITFDDFEITAIPEPTTWVLIGLGTAFVLWRIRRRSIAG